MMLLLLLLMMMMMINCEIYINKVKIKINKTLTFLYFVLRVCTFCCIFTVYLHHVTLDTSFGCDVNSDLIK